MNNTHNKGKSRQFIHNFMPGLETFTRYDLSWLRSDLGAGLSVAAIALPVGIAYADLAGVPAVIGMYSAIFPLLAYALFGSSRQLMTGPDAATCIIVAASLGPLAGGDPERYLALMVVLTLMTGILFVAAGFLRTAVNNAMGGKTQLVGIVAAGSMLLILFFLTKPLGYVPTAALAAVIMVSAVGLFDFAEYRFDTIKSAVRAFNNRTVVKRMIEQPDRSGNILRD